MNQSEDPKRLLDAIERDITTHELEADKAMTKLEDMKATSEEYKKANLRFSRHNFVASYLRRLSNQIEVEPQSAENIIRFHAHYQHVKGCLNDGSDISKAQANIAFTLEGYVERFFNAEPSPKSNQ